MKKIRRRHYRLLGALVSGCMLNSSVLAACYIGSEQIDPQGGTVFVNETNADTVQSDSGNGDYDCSLFNTANGALGSVNYQTNPNINVSINNGTVTWSVATDIDGNPLVDVDLVSVYRNNGKRCNYVYTTQQQGGSLLSTSSGNATGVTVCADGVIQPLPEPPPPQPPVPFSSFTDACQADWDLDGNSSTASEKFDVAFGYSKQFFTDGVEGAAVCIKGGQGQRQCVNECVPRDITGQVCTPNALGEVPLTCATCELSYDGPFEADGDDLKYCWYYENRVCEAGVSDPGYCNNRAPDTFVPSPKKKTLQANIDVTTGSDCYTVTVGPLYGGYTYSYWYCP